MRYCNIFKKTSDEYDRYWMSVSTEKVGKNGKGTGEYIRASITVRMSNDAKEYFDEHSTKTKSKDVRQGCFNVKDCFFKAVEPKEGEPFVILFVNKIEVEDD